MSLTALRRSGMFACALTFASFATQAANAQYVADFESPTFNATAAGMPLAGQDAFYVPIVGSADGACYPYAGNALGIAANPNGGNQFVACTRSQSSYARAQHNLNMIGDNCWVHEFEFCLKFVGDLPTTNYAGSYSLQPYPGAGSFIILFYWDDPTNAETFSIRVLGYDVDGGTPFTGGVPAGLPGFGEAFRGLLANNWYRLGLRLEFSRNTLSAISIQDVMTDGPTTGFIPTDLEGYYLGGGEDSHDPPTAFRFYGGGGFAGDRVAGNTLAIDNLRILPAGATDCIADINFDREVDIDDLAFLLSKFGLTTGAFYADGDLDCDGDVDIDDLAFMLANFGTICN